MAPVESPGGPRSVRLADWPALDDRALSDKQRVVYLQRQSAVEAYVIWPPKNGHHKVCYF